MIDDIVRMIFEEARARDAKNLIYEVTEVMRIVNVCLDQTVSIYLQEKKKEVPLQVWKDSTLSHNHRKHP